MLVASRKTLAMEFTKVVRAFLKHSKIIVNCLLCFTKTRNSVYHLLNYTTINILSQFYVSLTRNRLRIWMIKFGPFFFLIKNENTKVNKHLICTTFIDNFQQIYLLSNCTKQIPILLQSYTHYVHHICDLYTRADDCRWTANSRWRTNYWRHVRFRSVLQSDPRRLLSYACAWRVFEIAVCCGLLGRSQRYPPACRQLSVCPGVLLLVVVVVVAHDSGCRLYPGQRAMNSQLQVKYKEEVKELI